MRGREVGAAPAPVRFVPLLLAVGAAAQTAQILFLRELMSVSYGTEVAAALLLGVWMAGAAAGSALAGRRSPLLCSALLAASVVPFLALVRFSRAILALGSGQAVPLWVLLLVTLATSFPVAAFSGALFAATARRSPNPGRAYAVEAAGAGLAGFILLLVLPLAPSFSLALAAASLPLILGLRGRRQLVAVPALALLVGVSVFADGLAARFYWHSFSRGKLLEAEDSPYGPLAAVEYGGQVSIYQSGRLLFSLPDRGEAAPPVHLAMLRHRDPKVVLLVGGGVGGALKEVLRHPISAVLYFESDPQVVPFVSPYSDGSLGDPRVFPTSFGARDYPGWGRHEKMDLVLVFVGEPSTLAANRFYTIEYFRYVRRILDAGGVLLVGPVSSHDAYADERTMARNGLLLNTLRQVFPGGWVTAGKSAYFVAGGDDRVEERAAARGITDVDFYSLIESFALEKVNAELTTGVEHNPLEERKDFPPAEWGVNRDGHPLAVLRSVALEAENVRDPSVVLLDVAGWTSPLVAIGLFVLIGAGSLLRPGTAAGAAVFGVGFFASGSVLLLLAAYQAAFGTLYLEVALILGVFMMGMAAGAWCGARIPPAGTLFVAAVASIALAKQFGGTCDVFAFLSIIVLAFAAGACTGALFPAALRRVGGERVGRLYAVDLAGGMIGALIFAPIALPVWGATWACGVLAFACLACIPGVLRKA
ncbi:MAG: spermine/spermidine synthase domain-containing protein [Planctomycetota bacterium]|jgi:spermidine synthase